MVSSPGLLNRPLVGERGAGVGQPGQDAAEHQRVNLESETQAREYLNLQPGSRPFELLFRDRASGGDVATMQAKHLRKSRTTLSVSAS